MRALSNILLLFNVQPSTDRPPVTSSPNLVQNIPFLSSNPLRFNNLSAAKRNEQRNLLVQELLEQAAQVGQVGSPATEEERNRLSSLAETLYSWSDPNPAKVPLTGEHRLVYSAAPGPSSGRIVGNTMIGTVTQLFESKDIFYNRVMWGPLTIALRAKRDIKNDSTIQVSFLETTISFFGRIVSKKQAGGGGVWKCRFVGKVQDANGKEKLVRIMETPSLFILEQPLN